MTLRRLRLLLWILALSAVGTSAGIAWYRWYAAHHTDSWALELDGRPAPAFRLLDQDGRLVSLDSLDGDLFVVTFAYTTCPDTCPLTLRRLVAAHQRLPTSLRDRVRLLAITVDPERDTPERIRHYVVVNGFDSSLRFLTGERAALEPVWSSFGLAVMRQPLPHGQYDVQHTAVTYILDRNGSLRYLIRDEALEPARLADLLERLVR
ncbi:SCO family protein [Thermomicrobium sp.]